MRIKQYFALFLAVAMALALGGCRPGPTGGSNKTIAPAQLTDEEEALASLLNVETDSYRIFDFVFGSGSGREKEGEGVQSVQLTLYELSEGEWAVKSQARRAFSDARGRVALSFGKITEGVNMAIQSENMQENMSLDKITQSDTGSMSYTTSVLTESADLELDKETPLAIQIVTSKNDIQSYGVQYFEMPREYAKHGYEHVYAITVMFSEKTVYELADSAAPKSETK